MPSREDRVEIMKIHAGTNHTLSGKDFELLSRMTEGFSGSDLSIAVNEALMRPIKEISQVDEFVKVPRSKIAEYDQRMGLEDQESYAAENPFVWIPKTEGHPLLETSSLEAEVMKLSSVTEDPALSDNIFIRNPQLEDFKKSVQNCKPSVPESAVEMYTRFLDKYGHKEQ